MSELQSLMAAFGNELGHSLHHYNHCVDLFHMHYNGILVMHDTNLYLPYKVLKPLYYYHSEIVQSDISISQLDP